MELDFIPKRLPAAERNRTKCQSSAPSLPIHPSLPFQRPPSHFAPSTLGRKCQTAWTDLSFLKHCRHLFPSSFLSLQPAHFLQARPESVGPERAHHDVSALRDLNACVGVECN